MGLLDAPVAVTASPSPGLQPRLPWLQPQQKSRTLSPKPGAGICDHPPAVCFTSGPALSAHVSYGCARFSLASRTHGGV